MFWRKLLQPNTHILSLSLSVSLSVCLCLSLSVSLSLCVHSFPGRLLDPVPGMAAVFMRAKA